MQAWYFAETLNFFTAIYSNGVKIACNAPVQDSFIILIAGEVDGGDRKHDDNILLCVTTTWVLCQNL